MRAFVMVLSIVCWAVTPAAPVWAAGGTDHAVQLVGTWTCRSGYGDVTRLSYRPDGDGLVSAQSSLVPGGRETVTRYRPQADGSWRVLRSQGDSEFDGTAPAWTGDVWPVSGYTYYSWGGTRHGVPAPVTQYQMVDGNTLRIAHADVRTARVTPSALCVRGGAPPDASICVAPELPAITVAAVEPDTPSAAQQLGLSGRVVVLVAIGADDRVSSVRVKSSTNDIFNLSALAAARASRFHTARHECAPVPSEYEFAVEYSTR